MTSAQRLRDAVEPIGTHSFWSPLVNERMAARGMNFLRGCAWGRAMPMVEPVGQVVASAFAAFEPGLIASLPDESRAVLARSEMLGLLETTVPESLRQIIGDAASAEVAAVVEPLRRAVEADAQEEVDGCPGVRRRVPVAAPGRRGVKPRQVMSGSATHARNGMYRNRPIRLA